MPFRRAKRYSAQRLVSPVKTRMANEVLKTTRTRLLVCIIRCGEKRSTSDPPMSMKKTVGILPTAMIVPTPAGRR